MQNPLPISRSLWSQLHFTVSLGLPPQVLGPAPRVIRRDLQSGEIMVEIMVEMCKSKSKDGMIECFDTLASLPRPWCLQNGESRNFSASTLVFAGDFLL